MRRLLAALFLVLPVSAFGADAIRQLADPGLSVVYARVFTSPTAALTFTLTEGTGAGVGRYVVADSTVDDTLTTPGAYTYKVFVGAAPSTTADDQWIGSETLYWSGTAALTEAQYLLLTTTSDAGSGTIGRALHYLRVAWASSGVYSETALANGVAGSGVFIAPTSVKDSRTWFADRRDSSKAGNIVIVKVGFAGTLAAALDLNDAADISSVASVEITDPDDDDVTATSLAKTADGRRAHFDVPELTLAGDYVVVVTVNTLDSQTIPMLCKLRVRP